MAIDQIAVDRYAEAVFLRAQSEGKLETLTAEVRSLLPGLGGAVGLDTFLISPRIGLAAKRALIEKVLSQTEATQLDELAHLLLDKARIDHFRAILERFLQLEEEHRGVHPAHVTTAYGLSDEERGTLQSLLEGHTGHTLRIDWDIDPEILGGVIFRHRDEMIDTSLRSGLDEVRERLSAVRVH